MNAQTKKKVWRFIYLALAALVLFYVVYQIYEQAHEPVKTVVAQQTTVSDSTDAKLFVVRDEEYLKSGSNGIMIPLISSGSRVSVGEAMVAVFDSEADASRYAERNQVEANLARYTRLNEQKGTYAVNLSAMGKRVSEDVIDLAELVDSGDLTNMQEQVYDVRDQILARQVATGENVALENKVTELTNRQKVLAKQGDGYTTLDAKHSGFFIDSADGYENATRYSNVSDLSAEDIQKLLKSKPDKVPGKVIGKLSKNFDWYLLCSLSSKEAGKVKVGDTVTIDLPYSAVQSIDATVSSKQKADSNGNVAVCFKCNRMNAYIASLRKEEGKIVLHTYTGLKIPKKAVATDENGKKGVYVLEGNIAHFKQLRTLYTDDDYLISSETPKEGETGDYVALYDSIITGGKNLYDGKIIH